MNKAILAFFTFTLLQGCAAEAASESGTRESVPSEFRQSVQVEFLYTEFIGEPYSTNWFGKLIKTDGEWRDVYVETNEKYTGHGILSFKCTVSDEQPGSQIAYIDYPIGSFGEGQGDKQLISFSDRPRWMAQELDTKPAYMVPYEVYVVAFYKYC